MLNDRLANWAATAAIAAIRFVGLLLGYGLFFAFMAICLIVCPPVYLTCRSLAWAAEKVSGWRDGMRGGWVVGGNRVGDRT